MSLTRIHRPVNVFICLAGLVCFLCLNSHAATVRQNGFKDTTDTSKTATRIINREFSDIYEQNLRPSFFGQELFQPIKTLLVGDINGHFILFNTPRSRFFFELSARVKVRLLKEQGSPVKSPSYIPGGNLYFRLNHDTYRPQFLQLGYTHHSNGIRGPTLRPDGSFNRDSGKFATNYFTLNYTAGKRMDKPGKIINHYGNIGLEIHTGLFETAGTAVGLQGHYGFVRVNGGYTYNIAKRYTNLIDPAVHHFNNWQRMQFEFTYIADRYDNYNAFNFKKRLNASIKYYYQFPFMQNVSLIIGAGYRGQDDYNIFFEDSYAYMTFGLSSGLTFLSHKN